jgi:hypothetical protein
MIDFSVVGRIAEAVVAAVLGAFLGALATRAIERRARLTAFYGHVGEFQLQPMGNNPGITVHTHSVVVRNTGRLAAHNVRMPHAFPLKPPLNFSVFPQTAFNRTLLASGGEEITFPILVPGEQVTVSYLYFPPLVFRQINLPIKSDEGMARVIDVLPTPRLSRWRLVLFWMLVIVGAVTSLYLLAELGLWTMARVFP